MKQNPFDSLDENRVNNELSRIFIGKYDNDDYLDFFILGKESYRSLYLNSINESNLIDPLVQRLNSELKDEDRMLNEVNIYPNPFNNYLKIQFRTNKQSILRIELFDQLGKLVYVNSKIEFTRDKNIVELNLNDINLSKGIYYCRIGNDSKSVFSKILLKI